MTLLIALLASYAVVGLLCYEAGADERKRAEWDPAVERQMDLARLRHPSADR